MSAVSVKVSCIVPTHERPELLAKAVESILGQATHLPIEIIVVDDALDENSRSVVSRLQENTSVPLTYMQRVGERGASASRNFGADMANGQLLAFLDDDDLWHADFLQSTVDVLETSGADMAISWLEVLEVNGDRRPLLCIAPDIGIEDAAARNAGFTGSNFVITATAFAELGGFDQNLQVSNDKDFLVRFLLAEYRYAVVDRYLAIHRRHAGPQLTRGNERRAHGVEAYLNKHKAVLTLSGRRYLRKRVHRIRMITSQNMLARIVHTAGFVANLSLRDLTSKWRRRDGRYSDFAG